MKLSTFLFALTTISLFSCKSQIEEDFTHCNVSFCQGFQDGSYCLFGLKWGEDQNFDFGGIESMGPQFSGGIITFSFVTETLIISSGLNVGLETVPFDDKGECARDQARLALAEWEKHADFSFQEVDDNSDSDIKFVAAAGVIAALGNPNFEDNNCQGLSGRVFFSGSEIPCELIYSLCLHEIGHVLGLGHVNSSTIMGTASSNGIDKLQAGDIAGIQAIYGKK